MGDTHRLLGRAPPLLVWPPELNTRAGTEQVGPHKTCSAGREAEARGRVTREGQNWAEDETGQPKKARGLPIGHPEKDGGQLGTGSSSCPPHEGPGWSLHLTGPSSTSGPRGLHPSLNPGLGWRVPNYCPLVPPHAQGDRLHFTVTQGTGLRDPLRTRSLSSAVPALPSCPCSLLHALPAPAWHIHLSSAPTKAVLGPLKTRALHGGPTLP